MAAPMVRNFFEPLEDEIKEIIAPPMKALVVIPEGCEGENILKAIPIEEGEGLFDPVEILRALPIDEDEEVSEGFQDGE